MEHIGGTAVPGLAAKPVIDLLVETHDLDGLDGPLRGLGYAAMGTYGVARRRYFRKAGFHVHAFAAGDGQLLRYRAVRDYLRADVAEREAYGAFKFALVAVAGVDREGYSAGKAAFVDALEERALDWWVAALRR